MYCDYCGSNIDNNSTECKYCGAKVLTKNRFCRFCGKELFAGKAFCGYCGKNSDLSSNNGVYPQSVSKLESGNQKQSQYYSYNNIILPKRRSKKRIVFAIVIPMSVLMLFVFIWYGINEFSYQIKSNKTKYGIAIPDSMVDEADKHNKFDTGYDYAYMSDEWHVYTATPLTRFSVQIDCWEKGLRSDETLKYDYEVGVYRVKDEENAFYWVDPEHTAFVLTFMDENNSSDVPDKPHVFTINISEDDEFKGSNINEDIAYYTYENDKWNEYRSVFLSENLVKIECWSRTSVSKEYLYSYDVCVINIDDEEFGFEWNDDHEGFVLELWDPENRYYWKEKTLVSFSLENEKYVYEDTISYLGLISKENGTEMDVLDTTETTADETAASEQSPTASPTSTPTPKPTAAPTSTQTPQPTATPTSTPTPKPTATPTSTPTPKPTATPTSTPTPKPTATPTSTPTPKPTATPTPTKAPTVCEYAYVCRFRNSAYPNDKSLNYDLYFLFDTDNNKVYSYISTNPYTVDSGTYTGTITSSGAWGIEATIGGVWHYISGTSQGIDISDDIGYCCYAEKTDVATAESKISI